MTVKNTTSVPEIRDIEKGINFDNTDTSPKNIWIPANGKRAYISDVVISALNKQASSYIVVAVQVMKGGSWRTLLPVGVGAQQAVPFAHNFGGRIFSDVGDGSAVMVRAVRTGTSTSWESQIVVTGQEKT